MKNVLIICATAAWLASCGSVVESTTAAASWSGPHAAPQPLLGRGFGKLCTIEAKRVTQRSKRDQELLSVWRIDGLAVPAHMLILPQVAKLFWTGEGEPIELVDDTVYRLTGYESGGFRGLPNDVIPLFGDMGPPQARGFGFRHWFVVVDGEPIEPRRP